MQVSARLTGTLAPDPVRALADQARSQKDAQKLAEANSALATLRQGSSKRNDSAKAQAKERVQRLKEQIRLLRMLNAGDPKALARRIASLAKELAAAAKQYAAAGGTDQAAPADTAPSDTQPSDAAANGEKADPTATTADEAPPATATSEAKAEAQPGATPDPYEKMQADLQKQSGLMAQQTAEAKDRAEFQTEVRGLAQTLKAMIKQVKAQLAKAHQPDAKELSDAGKSLDEVDKAMHDMDQASQNTLVSGAVVNLSA